MIGLHYRIHRIIQLDQLMGVPRLASLSFTKPRSNTPCPSSIPKSSPSKLPPSITESSSRSPKLTSKGKWSVVFFYPADFTFVCPTELGDLADEYAKFRDLGVEIYAVSTDTHFTHKAWHDTSDTIKKIASTRWSAIPPGRSPAISK